MAHELTEDEREALDAAIHLPIYNPIRLAIHAAVERIIDARTRAAEQEPWSQCTGASDCPFKWHVHGCYADNGRCDDPLDHLAQVNKGRDEQRARAEAAERRTADYADQLVAQRCETGKAQRQLADLEAAVLALADEWRYKGEFGFGPWQEGHGPDMEGTVLDECSSRLRALVSDPTSLGREQGSWVCGRCGAAPEAHAGEDSTCVYDPVFVDALDRVRWEAVEAALAPIEALVGDNAWYADFGEPPNEDVVAGVRESDLLAALAAGRDAAKEAGR